MERACELRENATRYLRLSRSIHLPADVAWLEALAADALQAAEQIEAEEAAGVGERYPARRIAEELRGVARTGLGSFEGSDALTNRGAELEPDTLTDRRRPGRRGKVSPALIPLMREDPLPSFTGEPGDDGPDQLNASRGIIIWALISAVVWVPLALLVIDRVR
jgi:hypothetical protein